MIGLYYEYWCVRPRETFSFRLSGQEASSIDIFPISMILSTKELVSNPTGLKQSVNNTTREKHKKIFTANAQINGALVWYLAQNHHTRRSSRNFSIFSNQSFFSEGRVWKIWRRIFPSSSRRTSTSQISGSMHKISAFRIWPWSRKSSFVFGSR